MRIKSITLNTLKASQMQKSIQEKGCLQIKKWKKIKVRQRLQKKVYYFN